MDEINGDGPDVDSNRAAQRFEGTVKVFDESRSFGFVTPDEGGREIFVHQNAVIGEGSHALAAGERVSFEVIQGPKGPRAANIKRITPTQETKSPGP